MEPYSIEDLCFKLNLKKSEYVKNFRPFTLASLKYFSNPKLTSKKYKRFEIKKKNGGTRTIYAPTPVLKDLQKTIYIFLKEIYKPSDCAMGFTEGRSIVSNASIHVGHRYVYNTDIQDFFTTITQDRIKQRLQYPPFCFKGEALNIIAGICSIKHSVQKSPLVEEVQYVLPQGAPTSPLLSNAVCDYLDKKLRNLAIKYKLSYSRYADDITFSSNTNVFKENSSFIRELQYTIINEGFNINTSKSRLQQRGARQEVTGLVVCEKVNIPREYIRSLRQMLFIWERYGYECLCERYDIHTTDNKQRIKEVVSVIRGRLNFVRQIKGENDPTYQKLNDKFQYLLESPIIIPRSIIFIKTMPLSEFERINGKINLVDKGICHRGGYYVKKNGKMRVIAISSRINVESVDKSILCVSQCARKDGSKFMLVHYPSEKGQ